MRIERVIEIIVYIINKLNNNRKIVKLFNKK